MRAVAFHRNVRDIISIRTARLVTRVEPSRPSTRSLTGLHGCCAACKRFLSFRCLRRDQELLVSAGVFSKDLYSSISTVHLRVHSIVVNARGAILCRLCTLVKEVRKMIHARDCKTMSSFSSCCTQLLCHMYLSADMAMFASSHRATLT